MIELKFNDCGIDIFSKQPLFHLKQRVLFKFNFFWIVNFYDFTSFLFKLSDFMFFFLEKKLLNYLIFLYHHPHQRTIQQHQIDIYMFIISIFGWIFFLGNKITILYHLCYFKGLGTNVRLRDVVCDWYGVSGDDVWNQFLFERILYFVFVLNFFLCIFF